MKYTAPKAEVVLFEAESIMLSNLFCIIYDPNHSECDNKLPDFYS